MIGHFAIWIASPMAVDATNVYVALIGAISAGGIALGAGAWRLAGEMGRLAASVADHDRRISHLEDHLN